MTTTYNARWQNLQVPLLPNPLRMTETERKRLENQAQEDILHIAYETEGGEDFQIAMQYWEALKAAGCDRQLAQAAAREIKALAQWLREIAELRAQEQEADYWVNIGKSNCWDL